MRTANTRLPIIVMLACTLIYETKLMADGGPPPMPPPTQDQTTAAVCLTCLTGSGSDTDQTQHVQQSVSDLKKQVQKGKDPVDPDQLEADKEAQAELADLKKSDMIRKIKEAPCAQPGDGDDMDDPMSGDTPDGDRGGGPAGGGPDMKKDASFQLEMQLAKDHHDRKCKREQSTNQKLASVFGGRSAGGNAASAMGASGSMPGLGGQGGSTFAMPQQFGASSAYQSLGLANLGATQAYTSPFSYSSPNLGLGTSAAAGMFPTAYSGAASSAYQINYLRLFGH